MISVFIKVIDENNRVRNWLHHNTLVQTFISSYKDLLTTFWVCIQLSSNPPTTTRHHFIFVFTGVSLRFLSDPLAKLRYNEYRNPASQNDKV